MEPTESKITAYRLDAPRRGPGGHWFTYGARRGDSPEVGYGGTALEAIKDLRAKTNPETPA